MTAPNVKPKRPGPTKGIKGNPPAAPLGNQYAKGHGYGAPRKWIPEEEAKLLIEYAKKEDSLILRMFAAQRGYSQEYMIDMAREERVFGEAYEQARLLIGSRRETLMLQKAIDRGPYDRYAALYDKELKNHEKEMKQDEQDTKRNNCTINYKGSMDAGRNKKP